MITYRVNSTMRSERGSALITTLIVAVLLSMIIITSTSLIKSFAIQMRTEERLEDYRVDITNAIYSIEIMQNNAVHRASKAVVLTPYNDNILELINRGDTGQLQNLFNDVIDDDRSKHAIAYIIDSRDTDRLISNYAASIGIDSERDALNRPFLTLGEVAHRTGIPLETLRCELNVGQERRSLARRAGRNSTFVFTKESSKRSPYIAQYRDMGGTNELLLMSIQADRTHSINRCA